MRARLTVAIAALAAGARAQGGDFEVPPGFRVEDAADVAESMLALCFDAKNRAIVSVEGGPVIALADRDGDGRFETRTTYCAELESCQGLCWHENALFAVGLRDGKPGLFRGVLGADGESIEHVELVLPFTAAGEHGPHAVVAGPDGALYVAIGNQSSIATPPDQDTPLRTGYEGAVLPVLYDPNGQALDSRYPAGYVARVHAREKRWRYHSVGLRNAYDLAFDARGQLFTCDSDMEWDLGLPWYRPVRVLHLVRGGDYGSRTGSSAWPEWYADSLPAVCDVGRGSPTGVVFGTRTRFPSRYQSALFVGDWSQGRILAVHLAPVGASYGGEVQVLVRASGRLSVTDLAVATDGALYFVSGGRGAVGKLQRLVYSSEPPGAERATETPANPAQILRDRLADPTYDFDDAELHKLLANSDRTLRYLARMRFAGDDGDGGFGIMLSETDPRLLVEGLLQFAPFAGSPGFDQLCDRARRVVGETGVKDPELAIDALRAVSVAIVCHGAAKSKEFDKLIEQTIPMFPAMDPRLSREMALLLGRAATAEALAKLVDALESEADRAQAIHYAYCAHAIGDGWTVPQRRRMLAWFDATQAWSGGASFAGYLAAMREAFVRRLTDEQCLELARDAQLGLVTLAHLTAHVSETRRSDLVAPLSDAWTRLDGAGGDVTALAAKSTASRALIGVRAPGLHELLRGRLAIDGERVEPLWIAFASCAEEADFEELVRGLETPSADVRRACAQALTGLATKPTDAAVWRRALDAARRLGSPRGLDPLRALAHWRGSAAPSEDAAQWNAQLAEWETWLASRWPGAPSDPSADLPRWSGAQILAFLERSAARKGSPARGARVFAKAACARCHVMEGSPEAPTAQSGFGPDLTSVARRFSERELFDAIVDPSKAISDTYRTRVAITRDDQRFEGRAIAESAESITLLSSEGQAHVLARADLASLEPSRVSFMPEGLLLPLTLEETKDLFAFLGAEGRVDSAAEPEWTELFTGKSRGAWDGDARRWRIDRGVLVGQGDGERSDYLYSKASFTDFELELDVRLSGGNSGVQYRSEVAAAGADPRGYQADLGQTYWGTLYAGDGRGTLTPADPELLRTVVDRGGWNHLYLRVEGARHRIELNGATTANLEDAAFATGRIGFQLHAGKPMEVRIANARLRPLR